MLMASASSLNIIRFHHSDLQNFPYNFDCFGHTGKLQISSALLFNFKTKIWDVDISKLCQEEISKIKFAFWIDHQIKGESPFLYWIDFNKGYQQDALRKQIDKIMDFVPKNIWDLIKSYHSDQSE